MTFRNSYLALVLSQAAPRLAPLAVALAIAAAVLVLYRVGQRLERRGDRMPQPSAAADARTAPLRAPELPLPTVPAATPRPRVVPTPAPAPVRLRRLSVPAGTTLTVALADAIATDRSEPAGVFGAALTEDLVGEGHVFAQAQSVVRGRIIAVRDGGRDETPTLTLELESVQGTDELIPLRTEPLVIEGKRQSKFKRIVKGVGGAVVGAVAGGAVKGKKGALLGAAIGTAVAMRGNSIELPAATLVQFQLAAPAEVRVASRP